ncbi:acyl-CoA reductase [Fodinibius sp. N2]|uniref:acyl-CoA reductase n=1 Tax=Fodinibius alkaliphilus TaxID=3140241 RepID=UPI00315A3204
MTNTQKRINALFEATKNWLHDDNQYLADAIDRTVREGYFSFEDVNYAIDVIRKSISESVIEKWVKRAELDDEHNASRKNVLCLHAGNLPLVGFQDAFATLLSGARYTGKISRKDPYLLPTFLNEVKKTGQWSDMDVQWTHRLGDFEGMPHDAVVFAGSESSVPEVRDAIDKFELAHEGTQFLIRTAHFSMAYLDQKDNKTLRELADGILRYGGKGCRSVAVVVSPFLIDDVKEGLTDQIKNFWLENPQHELPPAKLKQQYAYNEAIERPQLWLKYFLLQEGGFELDQDFVCYWVQGGKSKVAELSQRYESQLQSIYVTDSQTEVPDLKQEIELLTHVQQPALFWKPDGVDLLEWLID